VEFILAVYQDNKLLSPGGSFGKVMRHVDGEINLRGKPFFDSYETLNVILLEGFSLAKDLINELNPDEK